MSSGAAAQPTRPLRRRADIATLAVLAVVAYLPALLSSPGRMPADTKLYLYTDPGGLLARAASTFEPDQFAGWVPHQQITYLWPSGPWFWLFEQLAVPDWVAHRLWIGSILFAAGSGVRAVARRLGLGPGAMLIAALAYQCSPLILPYVSRTSLLLLPWAGLGWVMLVTIRSASPGGDEPGSVDGQHSDSGRARRLALWRDPAILALIVLTIGSANATALLMIVPGPVIWLATRPAVDRPRTVAFAARAGVLCTGVSLGWVAMVIVQARTGAPVLAYSETLTDVSRTSTGSEVLRQLGYWLFYIRDVAGPATSSAFEYLTSVRFMALSFAIPVASLTSLAVVRWPHRRPIALIALAGMVLSVGVHPIESSSPIMQLLSADGTSTAALALRSSTRALPLFALALALGLGVGVDALGPRLASFAGQWRHGALPKLLARCGAAFVGVLVVANLPVLWQTALVDPAIDRDDALPVAWQDGIDDLRSRSDSARTLQLPGAEFGAFRWGYTVDQPLVGLAGRPVLTRDLLPLGSGGAMDLLYALDDRFQDGIFEPASLAPVARLLGADSVWLANDLQFERFRTPLPATVDELVTGSSGTEGLGAVTRYGQPTPAQPAIEIIDERTLGSPAATRAVTPVALVEIDEPGAVVRAKTESLLVSGSGNGVVDAAAAGLLDGTELVRYSADVDNIATAIASADRVIVTDSNRDRAHHWRSSQDVSGFTETGGPDTDLLAVDPADQRLAVFSQTDPDSQTIAVFDGPVRAQASAYGDPFSYLPEHRAAMAIDGEPSTSWIVGDHGDPIGAQIELRTAVPTDSIRLVQAPRAPGDRTISSIRLTTARDTVVVSLDESSLTADGQTIPLSGIEADETVRIEIVAVTDTLPGTIGHVRGVGFAEVDLGVGPTIEYIRPPIDVIDAVDDLAAPGGPTHMEHVLTRLRIDPLDVWRSDPEPELRRALHLPTGTFDARFELRLDARAPDGVLAQLVGDAATSSRRLTGSVSHRGHAAVDGDPTTAWLTPFDDVIGSAITWQVPPRSPDANGATSLTVTPATGDLSSLTEITVALDGGESQPHTIAPDTPTTIDLRPLGDLDGGGRLTVEVTGIEPRTTVDRRFGDRRTVPAGIAELSISDRPTTTKPPATQRTLTGDCRFDLVEVDGKPIGVRLIDATADALLAGTAVRGVSCVPIDARSDGQTLLASVNRLSTGLTLDRVVLSHGPTRPESSPEQVTAQVVEADAQTRTVEIAACPAGCWLVHGEGYNEAWAATVDGVDLGPPQRVDGGFNGWWLTPSLDARNIDLDWTAQRPVSIGLTVAAMTAAFCLVVVIASRRRRREAMPSESPSSAWSAAGLGDCSPVVALCGVIGAGLLISPAWGGAAGGVAALWLAFDRWAPQRRSILLSVPPIAVAVAAGLALWTLYRERPLPDAGWTAAFEHLNGLSIFSVFSLAWMACRPHRAGRPQPANAGEESGADEQTARR